MRIKDPASLCLKFEPEVGHSRFKKQSQGSSQSTYKSILILVLLLMKLTMYFLHITALINVIVLKTQLLDDTCWVNFLWP